MPGRSADNVSPKPPHQRALDILIHRCGRWSRVNLSSDRVFMVYDIAWGVDDGTDVAHITSNISPGPGTEHTIDFFHATEIARIEDPDTGAVLFEGQPD